MNADRILTILTGAGLAGLVILNAGNFNTVFNSIASNAISYVRTVQGR